jgi:pimeloyl-ACP methyl ester carboxylesterase
MSTRLSTRWEGSALTWRVFDQHRGQGRPLVLLHGASGSWTHWIRNIASLAARRRVIVPDMPGFGDSDAPPEPHTAGALADLLATGLDDLVPPPAGFDMAGFSFGGIVGGLVAARLGHRVGALVLLGAAGLGLPIPTHHLLRTDSTMTAEEVRSVHRQNLGILMFGHADRVDDLAVFLHMENVRRTRFKSGGIPASDVLLRALPSIEARIGGIWGSRDAFVGAGLHDRRRILASFQRDLDFRVVEGAGHWVPYEAAEAVNAALLDMLPC